MTQEEISHFLFLLYRELPDRDFEDYISSAFGRLAKILRFESGWIGHGTLSSEGAFKSEGINLYNQPKEKLLEYKKIAHLDTLAINTLKIPGRVHAWNVEDSLPDNEIFQPMRDLVHRFDLRHTLTLAMLDDSDPANCEVESMICGRKISAGISFARSSLNNPFSESDQRLATLLLPHFVQLRAMKMKMTACQGLASTTNEWQVFSSLNGCLIACPDGAREVLQKEWPQWEPPILPGSLVECLQSSAETKYLGRFITVVGIKIGASLILRICMRSAEYTLTAAQREVVVHIVNGLANKEAAKLLNISDYTVRNHLVAIYRKLGVRNKTELAMRWNASPASKI